MSKTPLPTHAWQKLGPLWERGICHFGSSPVWCSTIPVTLPGDSPSALPNNDHQVYFDFHVPVFPSFKKNITFSYLGWNSQSINCSSQDSVRPMVILVSVFQNAPIWESTARMSFGLDPLSATQGDLDGVFESCLMTWSAQCRDEACTLRHLLFWESFFYDSAKAGPPPPLFGVLHLIHLLNIYILYFILIPF